MSEDGIFWCIASTLTQEEGSCCHRCTLDQPPTTPTNAASAGSPMPATRQLAATRPDHHPELGQRPASQIAAQLDCPPSTVYRWLHRFNEHGIDGLGGLPVPAGPDGLESWTADGSSRWPAATCPGSWSANPTAASRPPMPRRQRIGPWMPWPTPPRPRASRPAAARSAASCRPMGCAGAPCGPGAPAATRSSPQTNGGLRDGAARWGARPRPPPRRSGSPRVPVSGPFRSGSVIAPMPGGPNLAEHERGNQRAEPGQRPSRATTTNGARQ